MASANVYSGPSTIHGTGVFTSRPITKGSIIWSLTPENHIEVTAAQLTFLGELFGAQFPSIFMKYAYPNNRKDDSIILVTDEFSYMNHSSNPNTTNDEHGNMVAAHDIDADSELTEDYYLNGYEI
jgi:hypothetical protein